ncbi:retrograde regulation protein 2 [Rhizodiscina lignyota]|uniref:Retrograde regulation protein 2 n=1 Tax=Rhizodiscina lignyota TaxID=1504668 RepID=A0A9P4IP18_9PEZI|nr:retrograde regulation protein 2 [Rhizodiscina lignyota]
MEVDKGPAEVISALTASAHLSNDDSTESDLEYDHKFRRRALLKVDFWLVGFYSMVYIFRVIDSSNYSNAAIINLERGTGIKKELHFDPNQWAWTLSIFSYSYLIFEPTNTLLLKKVRPSRWMFVLILAWGICASSVAAVQDFQGMMCARFAIGMAEAGFYPAVLFHMAFWYTPAEMPWRIAAFYSVGQLSSALSGLLAYAIGFMDGLGGLAGWRWLFLLEGLPAMILAVIALFGLPDYPETARMLTEDERTFFSRRLPSTAPSGKTKRSWDWKKLEKLMADPSVYTFSLYWLAHGIGGFGISFALPTVIYELGFTTTSLSQLMNIPPYVACFLFLNTCGYMLHRKWIRPWTTAVAIEGTTIVCYIILITVPSAVVRYLALIVAVSCAGSAYPVIWPERIRVLEGTVAAGFGIGLTNAFAQFGGIVGPHVYSTVFGPRYRVSYIICLSFLVVSISSILVSWLIIWRRDKKRAALGEE